ncbi:D-alanine--D-alanine ligase [Allohahella sp. A8]|uniref:D-alanine--D-alanine ligase n=1 Tax=Allohahella sp. A8 TaxID=3141461 RepID=UPI000C0A786B|nr:D-alanine--D-alanine ligase [Hahellaceae bacterium]|tara:strand:+ start:24350 stop:25357 length:1008 start_codon:yes stop_codon:yes gene_type:complete
MSSILKTLNISAADFGRVLLLYGGTSAERAVSLKGGKAVHSALLDAGIDCFHLDPADGLAAIIAAEFDRVLILLHGRGGEDGSIQGLLQLMGKPYTGSDVLTSALAMNKLRTKQLWLSQGLPTPAYVVLGADTDWSEAMAQLGGEAMVKPVHEGSSIGMRRVHSANELEAAWKHAATYDSVVIAEQYIRGREYTMAVLHDQALPIIGLSTGEAFYDYAAKYELSSTRYGLPCDLGKREPEVAALALQANQVVGARGWSRVDLMIDQHDTVWLLEVNTVPGMTDHSLVPMAAAAIGLDFQSLVVLVLAETLAGNTGESINSHLTHLLDSWRAQNIG